MIRTRNGRKESIGEELKSKERKKGECGAA